MKKNRFICLVLLFIVIGSVSGQKITFEDYLGHFRELKDTLVITDKTQEAIWRYIGEEDNLPPSSYDAGWMIYHYGLKAEINDHIVLFVMQENEYTKVGYILMLVYSKDGKLVSRCEIGKGGEPTLDTGSSTCDFDISLYPFCVNSIQAVNDKAESKANIVYTTYTIDKQGSIKSQVTNKKTGKIDYDDKLGKFIITSN